MGDFYPPKRPDVMDKLRRRLDVYRRRQVGMQQRYEYRQKTQNEQERQHALILRQKILDSKAKKNSKSKAKSDSSHTDQRNQIVQVSHSLFIVQFSTNLTPPRLFRDCVCVYLSRLR